MYPRQTPENDPDMLYSHPRRIPDQLSTVSCPYHFNLFPGFTFDPPSFVASRSVSLIPVQEKISAVFLSGKSGSRLTGGSKPD